MKLDVVAIPKDLLLLQLYNNALYQAPKFDIVPTIRQKVAGKKGGMPLIATTLVKEKDLAQQYQFNEVDLGAGPRELNIDLTGFEVDFTQYDELHGAGTAQRVIRELREMIAASKLNDEEDNFLADIMIKVNQELLSKLNSQDEMDYSVNKNITPVSIAPLNESDSMELKIKACQTKLEQYFVDPVINKDAESRSFLKDLKNIIDTRKIPEKYKDGRVSEFYAAWLSLIDPNTSAQQKEIICTNLCKKYSDKDTSFAGILFHLPKVMTLEFLKYSSIESVYACYKYREKYKDFQAGIQDYFADLVKMMIHSPTYSGESKQRFLNHLLNFFQNLKDLRANSWGNSKDEVKEALSCWLVTNSLGKDSDISQLKLLLSEQYIQIIKDFDIKLASLLQQIRTSENISSIRLDFYNYIDRLILKQCFKNLEPNLHDRLFSITRRIDDKHFETLYKIILDCKLQPNAILINHALLVAKEDYNHDNFPGLFVNRILPFLKSKCTSNEFKEFLRKFAQSLNPVFYAHDEWAFEKNRADLLNYWITENPEKLIEAIKISIHLKSSTHETPIMRLIGHIPSEYFNDQFLNGLLKQLDTLEFITLFSVCSDEVQQQIITKLFKTCDSSQAIEKIREFNKLYQDAAFPTRFKEAFVKHLKSINGVLFDTVKSEQLFNLKEQSELSRDLDNLKEILNNQQLTHDQRRSEIHGLAALLQAFRDTEDACSVAMAMFEAIPRAQWPYLFTYFDAQIIHWSFPHDKDHLKLLKRIKSELPPERTNTWLNHLDIWKNILSGTLSSISKMRSDHSEEGSVAAWALGHIQVALSKSATYLPDFPNIVLKEFFLADVVKSMRIFGKITERSRDKYDFNEKHIVNDALIASWLPDNIGQRLQLLSAAFNSKVLKSQNKLKEIEVFLKEPYVRNDNEQEQLILRIVNDCGIHIINFFEKFNWDSRKIIIQALYRLAPADTEGLLVRAMNNIIDDIPEDNENYFRYIDLLLSILKYTDIDVFKYVDQVTNKQKLVDALSNLDFWKAHSAWDIAPVLKLNCQLAPDNLYAKITEYFEFESQKYFSLYTFTKLFGAAEKVAIPPYKSYSDYLSSHPEERAKYAQLLVNNIELFMRESDFKAIEFASTIIPEIGDHILKQLVSEIKPSEQLEDRAKYAQEKRKACLDNLVQVYGAEMIIKQCRAYGLEKQATYLESKFKNYPQILEQARVLCKWSKVMLNPDYRKSDKINPMEWEKIHKINEKTLEVLAELAGRDDYPNYLVIDQLAGVIKQICERAKVSVDEFSRALPATSKSLNIKLHSTGALLINGIFARDNKGNYLSKAGMKFADQYLSSNNNIDGLNNMEEEFNKLDRKSQVLLQDKFSEKIDLFDQKCKL